jgi:hypothetical protein
MLDYEDALGFFTSAMYPTLFTQKTSSELFFAQLVILATLSHMASLTTAWKAHTLDSIAD